VRRLLVAAVVLLILGVAADFVAARVFEDRVTDVIQREYDLGRRPVVQVRDFPFLPHLATGRFSAVDVAATDLRARGVNAARLTLHLRDVRVPREVLLGEPGGVDVGRADGQVELTEAEVNRLLARRLPGASLTVGRDGVRVRLRTELLGQPLEAVATGSLGVAGDAIAFTPASVRLGNGIDPAVERQLAPMLTFEVPLPELPAGLRLEGVDTRPGTVVVSGRAAAVRLAA
jgi:LmeA-like phospholipid-binding